MSLTRDTSARGYRGRFAPSPTGPLHAGSLVAAVASFLDAHAQQGDWHVRIDDIDPPREIAGATERILDCLQAHGLVGGSKTRFQHDRAGAYREALNALLSSGHAFYCRCTRSVLGPEGVCIAGCEYSAATQEPTSIRVKVPIDTQITFDDLILGRQHYALGQILPNYIVRRRDGLIAYQLAAAVDDGGDITHVIRGADLASSTPRQIYLQRLLALHTPNYGHLPVITGADGHKLSKQTGAPALDKDAATHNLRAALAVLGQHKPPAHLTDPSELLAWAQMHWDRMRIPK